MSNGDLYSYIAAQRARDAYVAEQRAKLEAAGGVSADELRAIREYGRSLGWSDEELDKFYDHRAVLTLRDGVRWREHEQRQRERRQQAEQAAAERREQVKRAYGEFKQKPNVRNGARVFSARIGKQRR